MKRTGEILRKAREEKDLSLHEIGLSLKINNKILKAIEDSKDDVKILEKRIIAAEERAAMEIVNYINTTSVSKISEDYVLEGN